MRLGFKLSIILPFLFVLLMSHNTFAFDYTGSLRYRQRLSGNALYWQDNNDGNTWRSNSFKNYGRNQTSTGANYFRLSNSNRTFGIGDQAIIVITGSFYSTSALGGTSNTSGAIYIGSENLNCPIVDLDSDNTYLDNTTASDLITYHKNFTITCIMTQSVTQSIAINLRLETSGQNLIDYSGISFTNLYVFTRDTTIYDLQQWLNNNLDDAGSTLKQEKQDVQDASDNSETAGDSSQDSAEGATSSLLDVFGGFVSVITSASASNCVFNAPLNTYLMPGTNLNVDLCSFDPPSALQALFSIVAILIVVPFAISMFNKFIGIIGSFQNG